MTLGGIISNTGSNGLTFAANANGTGSFVLTGANTYSGTTTVSGGTLRLNRTGGTTLPTGNSVTVNNGGTLRISTAQTLNNVTVDAGGTLILDAALTVSGTFTVNGTLQLNQGGSVASGTPTYGSSSTLIYAGTSTQTATATEFPSSNGPANLTVNNAAGFRLPFSRTLTGNFSVLAGDVQNLSGTGVTVTMSGANATLQINGSITGTNVGAGNDISLSVTGTLTSVTGTGSLCRFLNATVSASSTLALSRSFEVMFGAFTVNGTLQIDNGGSVSAAVNAVSPTYGSSSTLVYNSGGTFNRGNEWSDTDNSNPGRPQNVTVQNNTTFNYPNGSTSARFMAGNLTVDAGSSFYMDFGSPDPTGALTVAGGVSLNGNLSLSNDNGGDIIVGGNWTEGSAAVFTSNSRAVFLTGTGTQTISRTGGTNSFPYLLLGKTGGSVALSNDVTVSAVLTFQSGNTANFSTGVNSLIISDNSTSAIVRTGSGHVIGNLNRRCGVAGNYFFPVGTVEGYTPVSLNYASIDQQQNVVVNSNDADHPNFATYGLSATKYVSRHWDITRIGSGNFQVDATFTYLPGDLQGGATQGNIKAAKYDAPNWTLPTTTTGTNSFTATGLTSFSGFMGGETPPDYTITTTGGHLVVTDNAGNGDVLTVTQDVLGIKFATTPTRTYSLDGGSVTSFPVTIPNVASLSSITINAGAGNDNINTETFTATLPSLTINGGTGDDNVNLNGNLIFAANANLDLDLQNDDVTPGTDAVTVASIADIALSGTGTATVKVSKSFTLNGGTFSTTNGNLIVEANQQVTPTSGTFYGVDINAGQLQSGAGNVTVKGKGGTSGASQRGVYVHGIAGIISSNSGTTTVIGTGGASSNNDNHGVEVTGTAAQITSFGGGNVSVTGQGGGQSGSGSDENNGVKVGTNGLISAGGSGTVTVLGTGGTALGARHYGVAVSGGSISSSGGAVSVTGTGGMGISGFEYGVQVVSAGTITAGGSGSVTVLGTGGTGTGGSSIGIFVSGVNSSITSNGGNVSVTGNGGGSGSSGSNYGVYVELAGAISAGGTGTVTVVGNGGVSTLVGNGIGVYVRDANSLITSSGGNVHVTGQGSASASTQDNYGVFVFSNGKITAGSSGTVTVQGTGGVAGASNHGVFVHGNGASATITSSGGAVQVTGQGTGTGAQNHGVVLYQAGVISAGGSGTVTVQGTPSGLGLCYGVSVSEVNSTITSSGGNVQVTGLEGSVALGAGINITTSATITTATNGGNIALIANSMRIESAVSTNGSGSTTLRPYDDGTPIDLGSGTNTIGGPLGLSDTELDLVTTGTLVIGNAVSGHINVLADITRPASTNMQLVSGGNLTFSSGGINTNGGTLLLDPGTSPAAVNPAFSGTDVTASTLSFGSDLFIYINGLVANTDYTQLNVVGAVNLSGVDLILSGGHTPMLGQTFTIVDNDGADAVVGTFNGLPQGAGIANFLGSSLTAQVSYTGGTGNDVVLTVVQPDYSITTTGNNIVITDLSGNGETLAVSESGTNVRFVVTPTTRTYSINGGAITAFTTPADVVLAGANSITVNTAAGADTINVAAFTANLPDLTINGGTGDDAVRFNGDITFATDADLDVDLQNDDATPGTDAVTVNANVNLLLSGTGAAVVKASKNVLVNQGSIETVNGNLTVEANQQTTSSTGTFAGVQVAFGGTLKSTGSGAISIKGKGGTTGTTAHGVYLSNAGKIEGGTGPVTVEGTGGSSLNNEIFGVYVNGINAKINSTGGNISVTGNGGGSGALAYRIGVHVLSGGEISAGGAGTVNVVGTGGNTSLGFSHGVRVVGGNLSRITSAGGNVTVTGTGSGTTSGSNYGVEVTSGGEITAGGTGTVTVTGTGGGATGSSNIGVVVSLLNTRITSSGGNVTVNGFGGGSGTSGSNYGVYVNNSAEITAGGTGNVAVTGMAGATSGSFNYGVLLRYTNAKITSSGGDVYVEGTGNATGGGTDNYGVDLESSGQITAGSGGDVEVVGMGAGNTGSRNYGVLVSGAGSTVTSTDGTVQVTGTGGGSGSSSDNYGVYINNAGVITNAGTGTSATVTVTGNGGNTSGTSGNNNYGVYITGTVGSQITSNGAAVSVTGTGGGSGTSGNNHGVYVAAPGIISAGGNGTVAVVGQGGTGATGNSNYGVFVTGFNGRITSSGGNVSVGGTGGGSGLSINNYGVHVNSFAEINAGGSGTVTVIGQGSAATTGATNYGVYVTASATITSAAGNVSVTGTGGGTAAGTNHGVYLSSSGIITAGGSGTVTVVGQGSAATGNNNWGVHTSGVDAKITSSGGNVSVTGTGGGSGTSSSNYGVHVLNGSEIIAGGSGNVTVTGQGGTVTGGGTNYGVYLIGTASIVTSSGGNVSVNGTGGGSGTSISNHGVYVLSAAQITAGGTGTVTVVGQGSTTAGGSSNPGNTGVYVRSAGSLITSSGGNVSVSGTGGGTGISANNFGVIVDLTGLITAGVAGTVTVTGQGGTAPTGSANFGVYVNNAGSLITSTGGNVQVTGTGGGSGTSGSNYGVGISSGQITAGGSGTVTVIGQGTTTVTGNDNIGVNIASTGAAITSSGGNVSVTGTGGGSSATSSNNSGVIVDFAALISAGGSGTVTVVGQGGTAAMGGGNKGMRLGTGSSITSSGGNVGITGTGGGSGTDGFNYGVEVSGGQIFAGSGGTVTVVGQGGTAPSGSGNYGVIISGTGEITSTDAAVSVTGTGGGSGTSADNHGVYLPAGGTISAGGSASVAVTGNGGTGSTGASNYGVFCRDNTTQITSSGGNVSVTGTGGGTGSSSENHGVFIGSNGQITAAGTGTVTVVGQGGMAPSGNNNFGVYVSASAISSSGGAVSVTGTGGGSGASMNNFGLYLAAAGTISAGGSAPTTIIGNGGTGSSGASNYGVLCVSDQTKITSGSGHVSVTGVEGTGPSGTGIVHANLAAITTATNGGNITLIANSMDLTSTVSTNSTGSTTLRPYTNGVQINLGSATNPIGGPLGLSDTELDLVTTGTLNIGNTNSGTITVSAAITRAAATNMELHSVGDVTFSTGSINTGGGDLLLDPGTTPAAVKPTFNGTDATAGTVSFASDLAIVINGTTPGNGSGSTYTQLTVAGAVDLTGVDLNLSGSHTPVIGQMFTIVDNDGVDAIDDEFTGLPEGSTIPGFLGSGLDATITYVGGDGNDVVLTVVAAPLPDYTITTTGNAIVITDISGNSDLLDVTEDNSSINFDAAGRTYSLDGGPITNLPVSVPLALVTSIEINAEAGDDYVNFGGFSMNNLPNLTVNGGTDDDEVYFGGGITFATDADLDVDLQNDDVTPGTDRVVVDFNAELLLSGTGSATIKVSRDVLLNSGAVIATVNGNLTVEANQQGTPTAGAFVGVDVNGGQMQCSGTGDVSVTGKGGDNGADLQGVRVTNSGSISGGTSGTTTVEGTGGPSPGFFNFNHGVFVNGFNSMITSSGGDVSVTGTGDGAGFANYGITVQSGGKISAGGNGTVTIVGSGAPAAPSGLGYGVYLHGFNSIVTSSGGDVSVTGTGGGSGSSNYGVFVQSAAQISAGGTGTVTVVGNGGAAAGNSNYGIYINFLGAKITSSGGNVSVTGTGGGSGNSFNHFGVYVQDDGEISAGGSGSVTVEGNGGSSVSQSNYGVNVSGANAIITSSNGDVAVTGAGGGSGDSPFNFGVYVSNGGQIMAGGSGSVTVQGSGGTTSGVDNYGVFVIAANAKITSSGGDVAVTGMGGGSAGSEGNIGLVLLGGGEITTSGSVSVQGTGGGDAGGNNNMGIYIWGTDSRITSSGGDVTVTATGVGNAADILLESAGMITSSSPTTGVTLHNTVNGIWPNSAGTDVSTTATQKTTFGAGSKLNIDIDGLTVNTEYQQLGVVGMIDLNNASLTFAGSTFTPVLGNTFTIVDNDGADAVIGTFTGLAQNAVIPNFLGSGLGAQISYTGGTGNDVVLTVVAVCPPSITFTATPSNACDVAADGQIAITGETGGVGPYMYSKDDGMNYQSGATFTGLAAGMYQVKIKDANGCESAAQNVTVGSTPLSTFYRDIDGDGLGDPANTTMACVAPPGYVADNTDFCPLTVSSVSNSGNCGCSPGYYPVITVMSGEDVITGCQICPPGSYCPDGLTGPILCPAGQYMDVEGAASCIPCDMGYFSNTTGATSCEPCPMGTFNNQTGQSACQECPLGTFNNATGQSSCQLCPLGTFNNQTGQSACQECPLGTFNNSTGQSSCQLCPLGTFNNATGQSACQECPLGTFNNSTGQSSCQLCPLGTFNNQTGQSSCQECPLGTFNNQTGQSSCQQCPMGTYNDQTGQSSCQECPMGTYNDQTGQSSCQPCPAGTYNDQTGQTECTACPSGTYNNNTGQTACTNCPTITFTATPSIPCSGGPNGVIAISAESGGVGPYMYSINNGTNYQSGATFTGLSPDTYLVKIKDANGCESAAQNVVLATGVPEIAVSCNANPINDDGNATSSTNCTDFGCAQLADGMVEFTYTITNSGTCDLALNGSPLVLIGGLHFADFTVTQQPAASVTANGGTTTFKIKFDPTATGTRVATVIIANDDADENPFTFEIQGLGTDVVATCPNDVTICAGDLPYALGGGMPSGGVFSGTGVSGNQFNPPPPMVQSFFDVFYTVTDPITQCENTCSFQITVNPRPATSGVSVPLCSNYSGLVAYLPSRITNGVASDFTWTFTDNPNVTGETNGSGDNFYANLVNTSNVLQPVFYTVTPTAEGTGCVGPTFSIQVNIWPLPSITCPDPVSINTAAGLCTAGSTLTHPALVTDNTNCPATLSVAFSNGVPAPASLPAGGMVTPGGSTPYTFAKGQTIVTYTATDSEGNEGTCAYTVTVTDNQPPTAVCQSATVILDGTGNATLAASAVNNGSTDNCGVQGVSVSPSAFTCANITPPPPVDLIISEYVEGSGNNKYIEIYNPTSSSINLGDYRLRLYSNGSATATGANDVLLSGSLASGATVVYKNSSATIFGGAATNNTAVNFNGNDALALFKISTNQNVDIFGRIGFDPGTAWSSGAHSTLDKTLRRKSTITKGLTANPADFNLPLVAEWDVFTTDNVSGLGSHSVAAGNTVTLTVTDVNGLQGTCTASVYVLDNAAPTLACPSNQSVNTSSNGTGDCTGSYTILDPVSDNCTATWGYSSTGVTTIAAVTGVANGANSPALSFTKGVSTVTLTATDGSGNIATTCSFTVTVTDDEAPTLACPGNVLLSPAINSCTASTTISDPVTDNCTGTTWTYSASGATTISATTRNDGQNSVSIAFNGGITNVTITAVDAASNAATTTCMYTVTVEDDQAPVARCKTGFATLDANGMATITGADVDNGSTDNCGAPSLSVSPNTFNCSQLTLPVSTDLFFSEYVEGSGNNKYLEIYNPTAAAVNLAGYRLRLYANGSSSPTEDVLLSGTLAAGATIVYKNASAPAVAGATNNLALAFNGNDALALFKISTSQNVDIFGRIGNDPGTAWTGAGGYTTLDKTLRRKSTVSQGVTVNPAGTGPTAFTTLTTEWDLFNIDVVIGLGSHIGPGVLVTLTATDGLGSESTCSASVVVRDVTAPTLVCPSNQSVNTSSNGTGDCTGSYTIADPVSDNCTPTWGYSASGVTTIAAVTGVANNANSPALTFNKGVSTVTLTATDASGNAATTCSFTVTVADNEAPAIACPTAIAVNTDPGECTAVVNYSAPAGTDNCPGQSTAKTDLTGLSSGSAFPKGVTTLEYTVTDGANLTSSCFFTVTVTDNQPPTITCPAGSPFARNTDTDECDYTVVGAEFDPTGFDDNCPGATITNNLNNSASLDGEDLPKGPTTILWTVTDGMNMATATCEITVNVTDNQPPTITCPTGSPFARNTDAGQCNYTVLGTEFNPTAASDNCSGAFLTNSFNGNASLENWDLPKGPTTITWTVTDGMNMASTTCQIVINVTDNQPPTITCPANSPFARNTDPGQCNYTVLAAEFNPTFNDNCPGATIANSFNGAATLSGADLPKGSHTITWTVTDGMNMASTTCQIVVNVTDNQPPTITCPAGSPFARNTDAGQCNYTVQGTEFNPTFGDNCPGATIVNNFNNSNTLANVDLPKGSHTITWTVTDGMGMSSTSCQIVVNVADNELPTITCPANQTISLDGNCEATVPDYTGLASGIGDNCSLLANIAVTQSPAAGNMFSTAGPHTVTLTATDESGKMKNCTFSVTGITREIDVRGNGMSIADGDNMPDAADHTNFGGTTPGNPVMRTFTVHNTGGQPLAVSSISSSNNTDFALGALMPASPIPAGQSATFTVTFQANVQGTYTSTITINSNDCDEAEFTFDILAAVDCVPPTITSCPSAQTVPAATGQCSAVVSYSPGVSGIPTPTWSYQFSGATSGSGGGTGSGATFNVGTTTVTLTATNSCGTTSCMFVVTVNDTQLPGITCPGPTTVTCSAQVPPVNLAAVTATDNCGAPTKSHVDDVTTGMTCANRKTVTRTYRATDGAGNSTTCSQVITVFDNVKPVFTFVPANVTVQCNSVPAAGSPTATDGCGGAVTITYNGQTSEAGSCTDRYTLTRQWTATDACGNTQTATQRINVIDTQQPNFTSTPANVTVQCDAIPAVATPTATDNCDATVAISYIGQTTTSGACPNAYTLTRRWVATDNCNNTRSISQRITVVDNGKPTLTIPGNTTVSCSDPIPPVGTATATDGCAGTVTVTYLGQTTVSGACPASYQIRRTWRATDVCGNSTAATQTIQVSDGGAPVFTSVPGPITIECEDPLPPLVNPTASDACGGYVHITFLGNVPTGSGCSADYTVTRTWRADDLCGNTATTTQLITVLGNNNAEEEGAENREDATKLITHRSSLIVTPNPTTDKFLLDLTDFAGESVTVSVLSDLGQLVWERRIPAVEELKLSVSLREAGAAAGIYTVSVRSARGVTAKRVVLVE